MFAFAESDAGSDTVYLSIRSAGTASNPEYQLSIRNAKNVLAVEVRFDAKGTDIDADGLRGFSSLYDFGLDVFTLQYRSGGAATGFSSVATTDIAVFSLRNDAKSLSLAYVSVVGLAGGTTVRLSAEIEAGASTGIARDDNINNTATAGTDNSASSNTIGTTDKNTASNSSLAGGGGNPKSTAVADSPAPLAAEISFFAIIKGFDDNTFRGGALMTREQFVTILSRIKNGENTPKANRDNPSFSDVLSDRWSYDAIEWALKAGIAYADANGNFRPADPLTRSEMAVMFVRTEKLTKMADNAFSDIDGHPDSSDILKAVNAKIFNGYPDGTFRPEDSTTRNEAVAALIRYLLGREPDDAMWQSIALNFTDVASTYWAYKYIALAVIGYGSLLV